MPTKRQTESNELRSYAAGDLNIKIIEGSNRPDGYGYPKADGKVWDVVVEVSLKDSNPQETRIKAYLLQDVIKGRLATAGYKSGEDYSTDYMADEHAVPVFKTQADGSPADFKKVTGIIEDAIDRFEWVVYPKAAKIRQQAEIKAAQARG